MLTHAYTHLHTLTHATIILLPSCPTQNPVWNPDPFERCIAVLDSKTLAWSKLLIFISKQLAFKFSTCIFERRPPLLLHPPDTIHVMNAPRPSLFFTSSVLLWTQTGEAWERGYSSHVNGIGFRSLLVLCCMSGPKSEVVRYGKRVGEKRRERKDERERKDAGSK